MNNKPFTLIIVAVIISLVVFTLVISQSYVLHSTESPNKRYIAEITQKGFFIERAVYLNAYRNGEQFVHRKLLYTGDFLDNDFRDLYPKYAWASESILRIGINIDETENKFSSIKIVNESPDQIGYVLIETSGNKIVLFDVEPRASIDIRFPFFEWLSCEGEFAESKEHFGSGARAAEKGEKPDQVEIKVKSGNVNIESSPVKLNQGGCCSPDRPMFKRESSY